MFRAIANIVVIAAIVLIQGCAQMTHLTRTRSLPNEDTKGKAILIDAKQRSIMSAHTEAAINGSKLRVCAEPSPDALSALATSSGLSLSKSDALKLAGNFSLAEGAGSIGLRTQSIQLMRDAMYRLCEGYLSGAIDGPAFETLHRRFQSSMVAILAIEQLTGVVRSPTIVLGGNATAGDAERAADLTAKTEAALQDLRTAEKTLATKQEASKNATAARTTLETEKDALDKKKTAGTTLTADETARLAKLPELITAAKKTESDASTSAADVEKEKNDKQASYDKLDSARQAALAGGGTSGVQVSVAGNTGTGLSAESISNVAEAVQNIVASTLELSFGRELCTTILLKTPPTNLSGSLYEKCVAYLNETVEGLKQATNTRKTLTPSIQQLLDATTKLLASNTGAPADKLKAATDALDAAKKALTPDPGTLTPFFSLK